MPFLRSSTSFIRTPALARGRNEEPREAGALGGTRNSMVVGGPLSQNLTRARSKILCRTVPYLNTICKIRELYRIYEYLRKKLRTSVNTRTKRALYANPPTLKVGRVCTFSRICATHTRTFRDEHGDAFSPSSGRE